LRCYTEVKRDKAKLTGTFLHLFTVDLQNAIPYFSLKSRIHLEETQITTILETFDAKKKPSECKLRCLIS
jgi:hypothetical protein